MYLWASSLACDALSSVYVLNNSIITFVDFSLKKRKDWKIVWYQKITASSFSFRHSGTWLSQTWPFFCHTLFVSYHKPLYDSNCRWPYLCFVLSKASYKILSSCWYFGILRSQFDTHRFIYEIQKLCIRRSPEIKLFTVFSLTLDRSPMASRSYRRASDFLSYSPRSASDILAEQKSEKKKIFF